MLMVGLYVGNNRLEDIEIPFTSKKVADTLQKEFNKSIVLVVSKNYITFEMLFDIILSFIRLTV